VQLHSTAGQHEHTYAVTHHRLSHITEWLYLGGRGADRVLWCDYRPETEENMLL
jgi:hypothetical protein